MGVTYKLKDEVVQFIISQRQSNPLFSCRQLAESASLQFGLNLSKSSVHDVLKESGVITPRGRKPKDKFQIPQEKKKQIQVSLSQVSVNLSPLKEKELSPPNVLVGGLVQDDIDSRQKHSGMTQDISTTDPKVLLIADVLEVKETAAEGLVEVILLPDKKITETSVEYDGAGKVFLKAARWDLGIFHDAKIKETDWAYYLTYSKGIKVALEGDKSFFIDLILPLERCIREVADGLINNVNTLIVHKVSDEPLFSACMEAKPSYKMTIIYIVDENDHILFEFSDIMELKRIFNIENRQFVVSKNINPLERSKEMFFPQSAENSNVIDNILNLKGFDTTNKTEIVVTLLIEDAYENKIILQEAVDRFNGMFLRDEENKLVKIKIQH